MLLETDITITNSPNASTQVSIIMNKQTKITADQRNGNSKNYQHELSTSLERLSRLTRHKPMANDDIIYRKHNACKIQYQFNHQLNPYVDENDGNKKFQLSKSSNSGQSVQTESDSLTQIESEIPIQRFFGNDRTNLRQVDRIQMFNRTQNVFGMRKENLQLTNILNNKILINQNTILSGNRQVPPENNTMFRNYDLNDEYWFNFE